MSSILSATETVPPQTPRLIRRCQSEVSRTAAQNKSAAGVTGQRDAYIPSPPSAVPTPNPAEGPDAARPPVQQTRTSTVNKTSVAGLGDAIAAIGRCVVTVAYDTASLQVLLLESLTRPKHSWLSLGESQQGKRDRVARAAGVLAVGALAAAVVGAALGTLGVAGFVFASLELVLPLMVRHGHFAEYGI